MKQITLMLTIPEMARADVMLTEDRVYYRFATEDTVEDGDLPGLKEKYLLEETRLLEILKPREGERTVNQDDLKLSLFVDNIRKNTNDITYEALERLITELETLDDVFAFVRGFLR